MALQVLTASGYTDLVSLQDVKTRLRLEDTADPRLRFLIAEASVAIERELGRSLSRQLYRETLASDGSLRLMLSRFPVEPGFVVELDGVPLEGVALEDRGAGILCRETGWAAGLGWPTARPSWYGAASRSHRLAVTYWAGYLLPGQVTDWSPGEKVSGQWARATSSTVPLRFECTQGGMTGPEEPAWPSTAGETVEDGEVVWTARDAIELPADLSRAAFIAVKDWYLGDDTASNLDEVATPDLKVRFRSKNPVALPEPSLALLDGVPRA